MRFSWWRKRKSSEDVPDIEGCTGNQDIKWWRQWQKWCRENKIHYTREETGCPYEYRCKCEACVEAERPENSNAYYFDGVWIDTSSSVGNWTFGEI